ncbi:hypothetical protein GCM10020370_70840 [Paenibacillus hodogayensis]
MAPPCTALSCRHSRFPFRSRQSKDKEGPEMDTDGLTSAYTFPEASKVNPACITSIPAGYIF